MLFFIIFILSLLASFVLPWWTIAIISFLMALFIAKTSRHAFWSGFVAIFIVWIVVALFKSVPNDHILAKRVAAVFHLPHWILLLLVTALIGGLVAGMSALTGFYVKKAFKK
ncbi:hypothetical protein [uncultured Mucilaginibacter sp.]|uniref:hypothetical protein n=1 Tax=uncultured Mucilaginibacter sp. TaxID=797541 RepID=UPI0025D4F9F5|nr:hypothetical protein [uncultured Mucilaginibacter sp.]